MLRSSLPAHHWTPLISCVYVCLCVLLFAVFFLFVFCFLLGVVLLCFHGLGVFIIVFGFCLFIFFLRKT